MNISQTPADLSIDNTIELAVGLLTQAFHHEVAHSCPRDRPFSFAAATVKALFAEAVTRGTADSVFPVVLALGAIDFGFEPDEGMTALTGLEVAIAWLDGPDPAEPGSTCTCGCEDDEDRGYEGCKANALVLLEMRGAGLPVAR